MIQEGSPQEDPIKNILTILDQLPPEKQVHAAKDIKEFVLTRAREVSKELSERANYIMKECESL